jgi:excisionase family DNA binding protein
MTVRDAPQSLHVAVWRDFQQAIWRRADGLCGLCGDPVPLLEMEIDHVTPIAQGGTHGLDNLQPSHSVCNRRKGAGHARHQTSQAVVVQRQSVPVATTKGQAFTVSQVASRLRFHPETVRRWLRDGKLRGYLLGGDRGGYRVAETDLEEFMAGRRNVAPDA